MSRPVAIDFRHRAALALRDQPLQQALQSTRKGFVDKRRIATEALPEFSDLCDEAAAIRAHALDHLDQLLPRYEQAVLANGGRVHWAETAEHACEIIVGLCQARGARRVAKGKSMVGEEIQLNPALEQAGMEVIETDLGEYIIQLAKEPPSHIIAPALHKNREQIAELFSKHHPPPNPLPSSLPEGEGDKENSGSTKPLYSRSAGWSPRLGAEVPTQGSDSNQTGALPAMKRVKQNPHDLVGLDNSFTIGPSQDRIAIPDLVNEARQILRQRFLDADIGITGANALIAENGSSLLVTNEGNGDLCANLPPVHIVVTGIEKVVPTLDDASTLVRVLARSATGQAITAYTSLFNGPRRASNGDGDSDGPEEYHVVLVDNGRSGILAGEFRDMLRCIRCGACLNHCPVYTAVGGHAYGSVYPGPMGSVLSPLLNGLSRHRDLPQACTLNGHCAEVCPVRIPLPDLMRKLRNRSHREHLDGLRNRLALSVWTQVALRPRLYRWLTRWGMRVLSLFSRDSRYLAAWTAGRDLPRPQGKGFFEQYRERNPHG